MLFPLPKKINTFDQILGNMDRQAFLTLTTSSQWVLFLGIGLIIFSWVEKKRLIQQFGQGTFVALGLFALWVILSDQIVVPENISAKTVPVEAKALTYFTGVVAAGAIAVVAFILGKLESSWGKVSNMILLAVAIALFFMVYTIQQM